MERGFSTTVRNVRKRAILLYSDFLKKGGGARQLNLSETHAQFSKRVRSVSPVLARRSEISKGREGKNAEESGGARCQNL